MNKTILVGRLCADPEIRHSQNENQTAVANYRLAVDRRFKRDGEPTADFINCVAFGKTAEFAEKYLRKGLKIGVVGRIQTGSYTNKDGQKVYTTDVVVEECEFMESKKESEANGVAPSPATASAPQNNPASTSQSAPLPSNNKWMDIPDDISEELPF